MSVNVGRFSVRGSVLWRRLGPIRLGSVHCQNIKQFVPLLLHIIPLMNSPTYSSSETSICNVTTTVSTDRYFPLSKLFLPAGTERGLSFKRITSMRLPKAKKSKSSLRYLKRRCIDVKFYFVAMRRYRGQRRVSCSPRRSVPLANEIGASMDSANNPQFEGVPHVAYSIGLCPYLPGINVQHRTTPREWHCINEFADSLSRIILRDLHLPPPSADFKSATTKLLHNNHIHNCQQQLIAPQSTLIQSALGHNSIASLLEATASRLEQVIMGEALCSILPRPKSPPPPLSSRPSSPRYTLVRFAEDVTSQVMKKACQSAKRRMRAIQWVADSVLCSPVIMTSSDSHSALANVAPTLLDDEESFHHLFGNETEMVNLLQ
ncbi:hypothetical protein EGR_00058 [Echinococcus granulosus]|uniref:Uncharacterized protein n=1 Tax=Echinococcus granulosus TaxID=6210 RepID=W6VCY5_ECHGR|nr:hypothetical protein EGR_00058 [Echinococcus granulosus]EUB64789.1 hypothetical protein EGR_00058 [Echinococcus granulosus]